MPHAETPELSPPRDDTSLPDADDEQPNHNHEKEVDPEGMPSSPPAVKVAVDPALDSMFDDEQEDEFTSSGNQEAAPMCGPHNQHNNFS